MWSSKHIRKSCRLDSMDLSQGLESQLFWICVISLLLCACINADESSSLQQCIANFDPTVDYYEKLLPPEVVNQSFVMPLPLDLQEIDTATGFAVNYGNYYKIVENQFFNLTYLLYQCGAPRPTPLSLGLSANSVNGTFQVPPARLSTDSTIPVAFLELLGKLANLSLTSSASDYISSACVLKYVTDGDVTNIPDSAVNISDVYFTAAQGVPNADSNAVSFDATYDGGPLKRAEWIKYLATFLNVEDRAESIFNRVNSSYQCMNGSMDHSTRKPMIAWVQYHDVGNKTVWSFSNAMYKLQFDSDAGGVNLDPDTLARSFDSSVGSEMDSFHQVLKQLDVVIDETYALNPYNYTLEDFTANAQLQADDLSLPIFTNKQVWRVDKRLGMNEGLDWYESAIPQPHVVLYDLIGILYPSKAWNQTYFRNIAKNEEPVNVSALVCSHPIDQQGDLVVIKDLDDMNCNGIIGPGSNGTPSLLVHSRFYLFSSMLALLILAR